MARKVISRSTAPARTAPTAAPYSRRRGIVASAARIDLKDRAETQEAANQAAKQMAWQRDAWRVYDAIGEIKFAYGLVASVMSRLRIHPAYLPDPESVPVALVDAAEVERPEGEIADGQAYHRETGLSPEDAKLVRDKFTEAIRNTNIPDLLRSFTLNINVPGECYIAKINDEWVIKSTEELRIQSDGAKLYKTSTATPRDLPAETVVGRIWRQHPRFSGEPDSSLRALIDDCDELLLLSKVIRATGRARLNAGLLFVPDDIVLGKRSESDDPELEAEEEVDFEKELYEALTAGVANEDAASTVHPLLLRGPGELAEQIKHIKLDRVIDEYLVQRADRTLERIMQGIDVPKELVTGLANVKYSNAIQIDDSLYKAHIEPLALVFVDAITDVVLRPALMDLVEEQGWEREYVNKFVAWYDPSEVVTRPDRAADALALYTRKELSGKALRKAHGFTENDAPDENELARRLAIEGNVPEAVMNVLLQKVLPKVLKRLAAAEGGSQFPDSLSDALGGDDGALGDPALEPTIPADGSAPPAAESAPSAPSEPTYGSPESPGQPPAPPGPSLA